MQHTHTILYTHAHTYTSGRTPAHAHNPSKPPRTLSPPTPVPQNTLTTLSILCVRQIRVWVRSQCGPHSSRIFSIFDQSDSESRGICPKVVQQKTFQPTLQTAQKKEKEGTVVLLYIYRQGCCARLRRAGTRAAFENTHRPRSVLPSPIYLAYYAWIHDVIYTIHTIFVVRIIVERDLDMLHGGSS